jgi:hypothetical protein
MAGLPARARRPCVWKSRAATSTVRFRNSGSFTSERIRIFCLGIIAEQARVEFEAPDLPPWGLRPTVSPKKADLITDHLEEQAGQWTEVDCPDVIVRGLAMWGVMRDTLPRLGELESMLVEDMVLEGTIPQALTIVRQPQGGLRGKMPEPETDSLSADTGRRLVA